MTNYEIISIIFSSFALILSMSASYRSISIAHGQTELYINERITNTKEKVMEYAAGLAPLKAKDNLSNEEKIIFGIQEKIFITAIENNINAYDEACAKYIDKKVHRKRFKNTYKKEITQLVEDSNLKKYFGNNSSYNSILKVYFEIKKNS